MELTKIRICRECSPSQHKVIKNVKNAVLQNKKNTPTTISKSEKSILDDYVYKNVIKKPEHFGVIARMAMPIKKIWPNGKTLTVSFIEGSNTVKERVKEHAKKWMEFANIELVFKSDTNNTDIRIGFDLNDGSWSYIGTDLLTIPVNEPTMNYGWLEENTPDEEYHRTVTHEFGHSLGCIHEHQNPKGGIPWDKKKAYKYYMDTQGWSKAEVDEQVFKKYNKNMIRGTEVDKKSIMMYPIPNAITIGNFEVGWNLEISKEDKKFMKKTYPKS